MPSVQRLLISQITQCHTLRAAFVKASFGGGIGGLLEFKHVTLIVVFVAPSASFFYLSSNQLSSIGELNRFAADRSADSNRRRYRRRLESDSNRHWWKSRIESPSIGEPNRIGADGRANSNHPRSDGPHSILLIRKAPV